MKFSIFDRVKNTTPEGEMTFSDYVVNTLMGKWESVVAKARSAETDDEYKKAKEGAPCVTLSGTFESRGAKHLIKHSGLILMDIDAKDNEQKYLDSFIENAKDDEYIHVIHRSIGGEGFAVIFKINPDKHLESFQNLEIYLAQKYNLISDKSCKDVSRLRFVSHDPDLKMNANAKIWDKFDLLKPEKPKRKYTGSKPEIKNVVRIAHELTEKNPTVLDSYEDWIKIGFALVNGFGEDGRDVFHILSQSSEKYDEKATDEKYSSLMTDAEGERVTMGSFFKLAKDNDIQIVKVQEYKGADLSPEETLKSIKSQIEEIGKPDNKFIYEALSNYVDSFNLRYNVITDKLESNGVPIKDSFEALVLKNIRILLPNPSKVTATLVNDVVKAKTAETYNPVKDEIERIANIDGTGALQYTLDQLVPVDKENGERFKPLIQKWLVSLIATVYGARPELCLVLIGAQQRGKTTFFLELLPRSLRAYFKSGTFSDDKDSKFAMTEKLLILNDEMTGFHRADWNRFKALISTDTVSERRAYAKRAEDKDRLAVFAGATNDTHFLSDLTGNRRIIPFELESLRDWREWIAFDKELLFSELYEVYMEDPKNSWRLTSEEVDLLKELSDPYRFKFEDEYIIEGLFKKPEDDDDKSKNYFLTATEIKKIIAWDNPQLRSHQIQFFTNTLKSMGYEHGQRRINGTKKKGWYVHDMTGIIPTTPFSSELSSCRNVSPTHLKTA